MRAALELEHREGAVALDREGDLLEAGAVVRARAEVLDLEAAPLRVAGQHPVEVARPERGLVAPDALPDLDDDVLPVGRILGCQRQPQLLLELGEPLLGLGDELAELRLAARGLEVVVRAPPLLRQLVRAFELLQAPSDLRRLAVVVVDRGVAHPLLRLAVGALEVRDELVDAGHPAKGSAGSRYPSRASSSSSTFPFSADETGQFSFASSAAWRKPSSSRPGTEPVTVSADFVIPVPGTKVTVADVSSRSGAWPSFASPFERAIAKHAAWAAAISSSGLVLPCASSARFAQSTSSGPSTPLVTDSIVPWPLIRSPCHVTLAFRSVAITRLLRELRPPESLRSRG